MRNSAAVLIALLIFALPACSPEDTGAITVHVAASMSDAVGEIAEAFTKQTGTAVQLNIASSGTLARQIAAGAPADVFISANTEWMDYLKNEFGLLHDSRIQIASNHLVVVVSAGTTNAPKNLSELLDSEREKISIGDPSHVPAGKYAQEALEQAGVWEALQQNVIPALDVRAALAYVERGEVDFGIVYASDALISKGVRVAFTIPVSLHSPIIYEAAMPAEADPVAGRSFLDFLTRPESRSTLEKFGFAATTGEQ